MLHIFHAELPIANIIKIYEPHVKLELRLTDKLVSGTLLNNAGIFLKNRKLCNAIKK